MFVFTGPAVLGGRMCSTYDFAVAAEFHNNNCDDARPPPVSFAMYRCRTNYNSETVVIFILEIAYSA